MTAPRTEVPRWLCGAAVAFFLVYALNFFYFFVDDEAIPYVYAQNLLHGRGLSYSALEGRVEGYSDFLHVWQSVGTLAIVDALHLPKWAVFFVGKGISLGCALVLLLVLCRVFERLRVGPFGAAAALAIVGFSGPLAIWSNSSLETLPFALGLTILAWALVSDRYGAALASTAFVVLERIDGPIYAGVLIAAFVGCSDGARRREVLRRVVAPVVALLVVYHGWRYWYFRDLVPAPIESKIVYKLLRNATLVTKAPDVGYLLRFFGSDGWIAAGVFGIVLAMAIRAGGALRPLSLAAVALIAYVAVVGDWMFGFRFLTPVLPIVALVCGALVTELIARRRPLGVALCAFCIGWSALSGMRSISLYRQAEQVEPFLFNPSADLHRFFHPYFGLYETARGLIAPGDVVAYNQAGFLPFMLELTNIDDLGICSRFYAELPTTDVSFTEVGRYNPLTDKPELHVGQAYLLYRNARYVIVRTDLLRRANHDTIPRELLGGYYRLLVSDPEQDNVIYRRTDLPAGAFASDPHAFLENVAHVSYIRRAWVDGREVPRDQYLRQFPFLRDEVGQVHVNGSTSIDVLFADRDEDVYELTAEAVRFDAPVSMELLLFDANRRQVFQHRIELPARAIHAIRIPLAPAVRCSRVQVQISAGPAGSSRGSIEDLRVQGQTPALERYLARTLTFPAKR